MTGEATATEIAVTDERATALILTPDDMIGRALAAGADIDVIERLVALKERNDAANAKRAYASAVADAKAELKPIVKNRDGHNSKYADLEAFVNVVDPIITKYGLSYRWKTDQSSGIKVSCILMHRDGYSEESPLEAPADKSGNKNDIQAIGSTLTYLSLGQALGLAVANDDDGKAAGGPLVLNGAQAKFMIRMEEISRHIKEIPTFRKLDNMRAFLKTITFLHPMTIRQWLEECDERAEILDIGLNKAAKEKEAESEWSLIAQMLENCLSVDDLEQLWESERVKAYRDEATQEQTTSLKAQYDLCLGRLGG